MSARNDTSIEALDVSIPVIRIHKEVENRTVMPVVISSSAFPSGDVSNDPIYDLFARH